MTFTKYWHQLPDNVLTNFELYCGINDPYVNSRQYLNNVKQTLNQYHAAEDRGLVLAFESEAHYTWFILRFS